MSGSIEEKKIIKAVTMGGLLIVSRQKCFPTNIIRHLQVVLAT